MTGRLPEEAERQIARLEARLANLEQRLRELEEERAAARRLALCQSEWGR